MVSVVTTIFRILWKKILIYRLIKALPAFSFLIYTVVFTALFLWHKEVSYKVTKIKFLGDARLFV